MRVSLNLTPAGFDVCNFCGAPRASHMIGDGAPATGRRVSSAEAHKILALVGGEAVRIEHRVANAVGAHVGVTIFQSNFSAFYRGYRKARTGSQELGVRELRSIFKMRAERLNLGGSRIVGQMREARHRKGRENPEQADQHDGFDQREAAASE